MKPHAWMLWLVVLLLCTLGALVVSRGWAEETHTVKPKDTGKVEKNFDIDKNDEEIVNPESVVGEGKITITTKTFKHPTGWKFKMFDKDETPENRKVFNPGYCVDIEIDPQCLPPVVEAPTVTVPQDGVDAIKVVVTDLTVPPTVGWPLKCEGNLEPPPSRGGGGGAKKEWHWSAKMEKAYVEIIDMPGSEDKTVGGQGDKKWTFAKLPPPYVDPFKWSAESSEANAAATIRYKRGDGAIADVAWDGAAGEIKFGDDKILCHKVGDQWKKGCILIDGNAAAPKMKVVDDLLQIHSVMQGDIIYVRDTTTDCEDRVHVVKDFSLNDMNRRGPQNLALHGDYAALPANLKSAIVNTIKFCLEDGPNTDQEAERVRNKELYEDHDPPFDPPFCVLDIPSARGIGYLADADSIDIGVFSGDFYHTHLAGDPPIVESVNTALTALDNQIAAQNQALGITLDTGYVDPEDREKFRQRHSATLAKVCTLLSTYTNDQVNPYLISHSYEFVSRKYYRGQDDDTMNNQDPLRHIKTVFGGNITLYLGNGLWEVKQISFFVERNGKIRLIVPSLTEPTLSMQILDALHEID